MLPDRTDRLTVPFCLLTKNRGIRHRLIVLTLKVPKSLPP